jgi:5-methylcytosine-specific restriction endonuclease McrA
MPPCAICGRLDTALTRHHLLPQSRQNKPRFARNHSKEEGRNRIAMLCKGCHSFVHSLLSEKELEQSYNSVEALREHPEIAKFGSWLAGRPPGFQPLSRKNRSRR